MERSDDKALLFEMCVSKIIKTDCLLPFLSSPFLARIFSRSFVRAFARSVPSPTLRIAGQIHSFSFSSLSFSFFCFISLSRRCRRRRRLQEEREKHGGRWSARVRLCPFSRERWHARSVHDDMTKGTQKNGKEKRETLI